METLKDIGELVAIERIGKRLPGHRDVILGAGDDCAIVRSGDTGQDWLLASDPVIENTHFTIETPPAAAGHKAVGRVLSDIAAMGGEPKWGLIDIVAPPQTPVAKLDDFYRGALELAGRHGFIIVGGDIAEGPVLEMHVFGVGAIPTRSAILRSGAKPGDLLFVTGALGGSLAGRHLQVEPRLEQGVWLRDRATAMIDVSDGLASDVRHITTASRVGCDLNVSRIPVSKAAQEMKDGVPALDHALHDGEDFELLFTVPREREAEFADAWQKAFDLPCTRIGVMTDQEALVRCVFADGEAVALEGTGYAHFG